MYPEEYNEDFDGTAADYAAKYNWDPDSGEVLGSVMPYNLSCPES